MLKKNEQQSGHSRRKRRIRKKVTNTLEHPRMTMFRSNSEIYVQLVNDLTNNTLAAASSIDHVDRTHLDNLDKTESAREVGKIMAERAREKNVKKVVFDHNGFIYHNHVTTIAEE